MKKFKKLSNEELRRKLLKCVKVSERTSKFENLVYDIENELLKRYRKEIFKVCCRVLKNRGLSNQFEAAACYADEVANKELFGTDTQHEIGGFYTKSGNPVVVFF